MIRAVEERTNTVGLDIYLGHYRALHALLRQRRTFRRREFRWPWPHVHATSRLCEACVVEHQWVPPFTLGAS